jgi:hypothetical protein
VPHSRIGIATTKTPFELKGKTDLNLFEGAGLIFCTNNAADFHRAACAPASAHVTREEMTMKSNYKLRRLYSPAYSGRWRGQRIGESILSDSWKKIEMDETLNPVALSEAKHTVGFRYKELFGAVFILGGLAGLILFVYAVYLTK